MTNASNSAGPAPKRTVTTTDGLIDIEFPPNGQANFAEACAKLAMLRASHESAVAEFAERRLMFRQEQKRAEFSELCRAVEERFGFSGVALTKVFAALPDDEIVSFSEGDRTVHKTPQAALSQFLNDRLMLR